jgi:deoxyribodipyrimidine photo-lyase
LGVHIYREEVVSVFVLRFRAPLQRWCSGTTGYQWWTLECVNNKTGYMHNRVRMVVASFLCKHLLINWQWEKLILLKVIGL